MTESAITRPAPSRTGFQIQRDVIYALLLREFGSRFGKSRVGLVWVLAEPLAHLIFPIALFGLVMNRSAPGVDVYPTFLVYGFLPFLLFKSICVQTMEGTNANRGLLSYRQVTLMDIFIAKTLAHCSMESLIFSLVLAGLAMLGYDVLPKAPLEFAASLVLAVTLAFGLGLLFAALTSLIPDAKSVIKIIFMPLYFASGVLFPVSRLPDQWIDVLAFNPVLHLVELSRMLALAHYVPMRQLNVAYPLGLALVATFCGLAMYRLRWLSKVTA